MATELSVVVPTLNEAGGIAPMLQALAPARARGVEVIVVDGGSTDATTALATPLADRLVVSPRGRSAQLNCGAEAASGRVVLFLHADSLPPPFFDDAILNAIGKRHSAWGRFDIRLSGRHPAFAMIAFMMNLRSRATGIATGDQGIFATRALYDALGGFPAQPLMEDIEFSKRARRVCRPICLGSTISTSSRRWERNGIARTVLLMWRLRFAYFMGTSPDELRRRYRDAR